MDHPEQLPGEVFLGNFRKYEERESREEILYTRDGFSFINLGYFAGGFDAIGWKTKRLGNIALDKDDEPILETGLYPAFAQRSEMSEEILQLFDNPDEWEENYEQFLSLSILSECDISE